MDRMLLVHGQATDSGWPQRSCMMTVVTALSLVLFVGFVATGVVGVIGWHQRMREGARS
jgi:hypothetical protein